MATKPPPSVQQTSGSDLEKIAYASVAGIPTVEPHDQDRLGYNVWRWLKFRRDSLEHTLRTAGARLQISEEEALRKIRDVLQQRGIDT